MYLYLLCVLLCSIETIIVSLCANKDIIIIIVHFVSHLTMLIKKIGLPKRSSASAMYATHNICNFETMLRKSIHRIMRRLDSQMSYLEQLDKVIIHYVVLQLCTYYILCTLLARIDLISLVHKTYSFKIFTYNQ